MWSCRGPCSGTYQRPRLLRLCGGMWQALRRDAHHSVAIPQDRRKRVDGSVAGPTVPGPNLQGTCTLKCWRHPYTINEGHAGGGGRVAPLP